MKKPFPKFDSDEQLEAFIDSADLDEYDLTADALPRDEWFARYELFAKDASIHLRLPGRLLEAVRARATKEGIPAQRLIRGIHRTRTSQGKPERIRAKASRQEALVHCGDQPEGATPRKSGFDPPDRRRQASPRRRRMGVPTRRTARRPVPPCAFA